MKHHVILWVCALLLSANAGAATYYLNPTSGSNSNDGLTTGTAWKSLDKVNASSFNADDIIDGQGNTFRLTYDAGGNLVNRLVIPSSGTSGHPIVFRNMTIDGAISLDGSLSMQPSGSYTNSNSWALSAGEVYRKLCADVPHQMYEDGTQLTPVVTASQGAAEAIARGQYSQTGGYLYYRASDGAAPSSHALLGTRRDHNNLNGLLDTNSKNYLTFLNVTVTRSSNTGTVSAGLLCYQSTGVTFSNVTITKSKMGVMFHDCNSSTFDSGSVSNNVTSGVMIAALTDDLQITNSTISTNGREKYYNGTIHAYLTDGDGIGIGGVYNGNITNVTISKNQIVNNGAPDGDNTDFGAGLYLGTTTATQVTNAVIASNLFSGNHTYGVFAGTKHDSIRIYGNVFYANGNYPTKNKATAQLNAGATTHTSTVFEKNTITGNYNMSGIFLTGSTYGTVSIKNNQIVDTSLNASGSNTGDLRLSTWNASYLTERNNNFFRGVSHPSGQSKAIYNQDATTYYDTAHIVGSTAGYWQYASGMGQSDSVGDPSLGVGYTLDSLSTYIDAGHAGSASADYAGNPIWGAPDIGAYEYQPPYTIGTDRMDTAGVRVYAGDQEGRFRTTATATGTGCRIAVSPENGTWSDLSSTDVRPAWADISAISCIVPGTATWTETPIAAGITNPRHRMFGMIAGRKYRVKLNGADAGSSITGCTASVCTADSNGIVTWHLDGAFDTAKTWKVIEQNPRGFRPLNRQ